MALLKIIRLLPKATNYMYITFKNWSAEVNLSYAPETMPSTEPRKRKIQCGRQAAILLKTLLKFDRRIQIYTKIELLTFGVDIYPYTQVLSYRRLELIFKASVKLESGKNMATRGQFERDITEDK